MDTVYDLIIELLNKNETSPAAYATQTAYAGTAQPAARGFRLRR